MGSFRSSHNGIRLDAAKIMSFKEFEGVVRESY